jgi:hypothetical protein
LFDGFTPTIETYSILGTSSMSDELDAVLNYISSKLNKSSAIPAEELAGAAQQIPGQEPPMDPAAGGAPPVDPATGMPMDPAMMDPAMMDPAMAGGPPMDPADDPILGELFGKLDLVVKKNSQILTLVASIAEALGVQPSIAELLEAGEDVVDENAMKQASVPEGYVEVPYGYSDGKPSHVSDTVEDVKNSQHEKLSSSAAVFKRYLATKNK